SAGTGTGTTLLAQGVRHGQQVRLPNSGGQWELNFDKPLLDVQVVGTTPDEVTTGTTELLARIREATVNLQAGVPPQNQMTVSPTPTQVQLHYSEGDPRRAMAGALLLGTLLTTVLASWAGRRQS